MAMNEIWDIHPCGAWLIETSSRGRTFIKPNYQPNAPQRLRPGRLLRSQFVTLYSTGEIGLDFPEDVPEYVKKRLRRMSQQRAKEAHVSNKRSPSR